MKLLDDSNFKSFNNSQGIKFPTTKFWSPQNTGARISCSQCSTLSSLTVALHRLMGLKNIFIGASDYTIKIIQTILFLLLL